MNLPSSDDIHTVLFDLDGTLLDTAADMAQALNTVLVTHKRAPLSPEEIRAYVSKGGMALICLGFNIEPDHKNAQQFWVELLDTYSKNLTVYTTLFSGMEVLLTNIEKSGRKWGIVTNKPGFLTDPLLRLMNLTTRSACVVSGDTLEKRKPDPEPLWYACDVVGTDVRNAVYIGDDVRDIKCGQRAGMLTIAAAYGYVEPGSDPIEWGADMIVYHPDEIWQWLSGE